jgi:hypothetical protein
MFVCFGFTKGIRLRREAGSGWWWWKGGDGIGRKIVSGNAACTQVE